MSLYKEGAGKPVDQKAMIDSLMEMNAHMMRRNSQRVAMPRIGGMSGKKKWPYMKMMLESVFSDSNIAVAVFNQKQEVRQGEESNENYRKDTETE